MNRIRRWFEWVVELGVHRRIPREAPPFAAERVRRILVVRNDNIGDLLCATPALRALRRAFPGSEITILVPEHCRPAVERNPDVDSVLGYAKAKHRAGWLGVGALWELTRVLRELRRRRFDLAITVRRPFSRTSAWLGYASGAPWRLGFRAPAGHPFRFFLNLGTPAERAGDEPHEVDSCLALLRCLGIPPAGRELTLFPDPEAQEAVRRRLAETGIDPAAGLALVHISNRRESGRWSLDAFAHAADALHDRFGMVVALSWAPGDAANPLFPGDDGKADEVARQMRTLPVLLSTPRLAELIAAVSLSDFVLSTDGGVMHIAAALGVPQVVLFGKTSTAVWSPVSEKSLVLQRGSHVRNLSVEEVVAAAASVISRWGRGVGSADAGVTQPAVDGGRRPR